MDLIKLITSIVFLLFSLFLFFQKDLVSIIFGFFVLGLGVYIFLDKKEDEIELIKKK